MAKTEETAVVPAEKKQQNITEVVLKRVDQFKQSGELVLPKDYSAENALKSAYLMLQDTQTRDNKPVLEACSQNSIANALLKMVIMGLNPMKKQCDFIPYNGKLFCNPEYHGNIALAKRFGNLTDIHANVVYEKDVFEYAVDVNSGAKVLIKHEQKIENIDNTKIKGAYAISIFGDGKTDLTVMTMAQIKQSWMQGPTKGESPAHRNFPGEMAKKTVINNACKLLISSSSDAAILPDDDDDPQATATRETVREHANKEPLEIEEAVLETAPKADPEPQRTEQPRPSNTQTKAQSELALEEKSQPGF